MARQTTGALKAVPNEPDKPQGDSSLTREAVSGWTAGQKKCRARKRHNWGPHAVWEHPTFYDVVERCRDCRNRRHADFTKTPYGIRQATKWKPDYRDGYLLPKGAAPIDEDTYDGLVASDILSRKISKAPAEEDD